VSKRMNRHYLVSRCLFRCLFKLLLLEVSVLWTYIPLTHAKRKLYTAFTNNIKILMGMTSCNFVDRFFRNADNCLLIRSDRYHKTEMLVTFHILAAAQLRLPSLWNLCMTPRHTSNCFPTFSDNAVVAPSTVEMKQLRCFRMSGTHYPLTRCHVPKKKW
jgi:hypothetical protein